MRLKPRLLVLFSFRDIPGLLFEIPNIAITLLNGKQFVNNTHVLTFSKKFPAQYPTESDMSMYS